MTHWASSAGRRICHFSFPPFQHGSWANNCENDNKKREIMWPEARGGEHKRLFPFRDTNVVLLAQPPIVPQASLLFRWIHIWTKVIFHPSDYGSITAQQCIQGCRGEEAFGFLIFWHFTGHTSALISAQIYHKTHLCSDLSCQLPWKIFMSAWPQLSTEMLHLYLNRYLSWYLEEKRTLVCHHWSEHISLLTVVCQLSSFSICPPGACTPGVFDMAPHLSGA